VIFNYKDLTLKFSIAGFVLAALPIFIALGIQTLLSKLNIECAKAWTLIWTISWIGALVAPVVFVRKIRKRGLTGYHLTENEAVIFNIIEYSFLQWSFASILISSKTLCYAKSGFEFVFAGWMAIPILIALSIFFDSVNRKTRKEFMDFDRL
jgi:hypothetical protein